MSLGLATVCLVSSLLLSQELSLPVPAAEEKAIEERVFREVGKFRVVRGALLKAGESSELIVPDLVFEVFTDGIDIRLKPEDDDESYLDFQIYRTGGIYDESGENLLPGVQAFSDQGGVVRHLSLETQNLVLTKFPPFSSNQEVTYAIRDES